MFWIADESSFVQKLSLSKHIFPIRLNIQSTIIIKLDINLMERDVDALLSMESEASIIFSPSEDTGGNRQEESSSRIEDETEKAWRRRRNIDQ